jgi:hypothetical protein
LSKAIPTNTAASAKQRLLNRARSKKEDFNLLLTKYALERVLYRISQSPVAVAAIQDFLRFQTADRRTGRRIAICMLKQSDL